uniref:Uncharacterized protein n=1 Tax=Meloidogyne incognita TaxID=6306 RepID=A0A914LCP9_MELIC
MVESLQTKVFSNSRCSSCWTNLAALTPAKIPSSSNRGMVSFEFALSGRKRFLEKTKEESEASVNVWIWTVGESP